MAGPFGVGAFLSGDGALGDAHREDLVPVPRYLMGVEGTLRPSRYPDRESSKKTGPWFLPPRPLSWSDWVMPPMQVPPETTNFEFFSKDQTPAAKAQ